MGAVCALWGMTTAKGVFMAVGVAAVSRVRYWFPVTERSLPD